MSAAVAEPNTEIQIQKGMLLLYKNVPRKDTGLPTKYELYAVKSLRPGKAAVTATLVRWVDFVEITATARFPDGLVQDPWRLFALSQNDLRHVYDAEPRGPQ